jgi:hypothetical protein
MGICVGLRGAGGGATHGMVVSVLPHGLFGEDSVVVEVDDDVMDLGVNVQDQLGQEGR